MGWPKKNEGLRVYFERKAKSYVLLDPDELNPDGSYSGVGEVLEDNNPDSPMLASTGISTMHLYGKCRRVSWPQLPTVWQQALVSWMSEAPETHRGLWRVGELEEYKFLINMPDEDLPLHITRKWKHKHIEDLYIDKLKEATFGKPEHTA